MVIALHTHVTNKSGAYQVTHDIFSMIAIHSALLGPQALQTKFEYVRDAIRTYKDDLHRKTLRVGPLENLWGDGRSTKKYSHNGKLNEKKFLHAN